MATIDEIKQQAEAVKNATQLGENTAVRVGGVLVDLANKAKELEGNIETKADSTETKNKFDAIDRKNKEQDTVIGVKFDSSNVSQELGSSEKKVPSLKLVTEKFTEEAAMVNAELAKKANAADVEQSFSEQTTKNTEQDAEIAKKANAEEVASKFTAEAARVDAALDKKANAEEVDNSLKELQNTVFPLQVSLSLDKTLLEFTGTDQTVKVSYTIKRKDALVMPSSLALSINGMLKDIDIKSSDTVSVEVHKEGESTLVLTAKYDELVKSATAKVVMVLPIYFGFGTSEVDVAIAGNKLGPRTSAAGVYEKTSAKDRVNFIILAPKTLPKLTNFTMGGAPFVMETTSVTINGKDYYMYKSGGVYMSGTTVRVEAS